MSVISMISAVLKNVTIKLTWGIFFCFMTASRKTKCLTPALRIKGCLEWSGHKSWSTKREAYLIYNALAILINNNTYILNKSIPLRVFDHYHLELHQQFQSCCRFEGLLELRSTVHDLTISVLFLPPDRATNVLDKVLLLQRGVRNGYIFSEN